MTAAIRANRWLDVALADPREGTARLSVIVPVRDPGETLPRTLAALACQSLPRERYEVIVVDDGSADPVLAPQDPGLDLRIVRQESDGRFGAGRARNTGARHATGETLLFLDADIVAGREALARALSWFQAAGYAVVTGVLRFADFDDLAADDVAGLVATDGLTTRLVAADDQVWREANFSRTFDMTVERPDLFRITIGAVLGVGRAMYESVGGFRELGMRGIEDVELGYRLQNAGGLMVLDREMELWHQGRRFFDSRAARRAKRAREPALRDLLPVPGFRPDDHPSVPAVPRVIASLDAGDLGGDVVARHVVAFEATEARDHQLHVVGRTTRSRDPRVRGDASEPMPPVDAAAVPLRLLLSPDRPVGPETLDRLHALWIERQPGVIHVVDDSGREIATALSSRAVGRARALGAHDELVAAEDLFGGWWVTADDVDM